MVSLGWVIKYRVASLLVFNSSNLQIQELVQVQEALACMKVNFELPELGDTAIVVSLFH
jgi:hypothetical protein